MKKELKHGLRKFGHFFKHLGMCGASTACGVATVGAGAATLVAGTGTAALAITGVGLPLAIVTGGLTAGAGALTVVAAETTGKLASAALSSCDVSCHMGCKP